MTIKDLKEAIADLPDDGEVFYERIEDRYFKTVGTKTGWPTVKQKGEMYYNHLRSNVKLTDEELEDCLEEYVSAFTPINYDKKNLYITAHY